MLNIRILISSFLLMIPLLLFSQVNSPKELVYQSKSVNIFSQEFRCEDKHNGTDNSYLLLSFENLTADKLKISFKKEIWYNNECYSCDSKNEFESQIVLDSNQVLAGTCDAKNKSLRVFHHMNNEFSDKKLSRFQLTDVKTNKTK